mgnify:FL=1|jgi:hypothetical protein
MANEFIKADAGKPRYDLLPPEFLHETAAVLTYGANKYTPNNWANGADWSRYFSAMQRHLWAWWAGEEKDTETDITHLAHAACCLAFLMAYENRNIGRDDRPDMGKKNED